MNYEIQNTSDFMTGASLIVKIPEEELDRKALHTIQADKPDFILPFHYKSIDGQVEIVYQVGTCSKLQYLSGERLTKEYTELWSGVFGPLLNCGDWFMNPYSFILSAEYLYYDKNKKTVCYVYIPSTKGCSNYAELKEMAAEVTRFISIADSDLENRVLRAIMKDFNPNEFLQMLKSYIAMSSPSVTSWSAPVMAAGARPYAPPVGPLAAPVGQLAASAPRPLAASAPGPWPGLAGKSNIKAPPAAPAGAHSARPQSAVIESDERQSHGRELDIPGEIVISIPAREAAVKNRKEKGKNKEYKNGGKEKGQKKQKEPGGIFGRKRDSWQEIAPGAGARQQPAQQPAPQQTPQPAPQPAPLPVREPNPNAIQVYAPHAAAADETQCIAIELSGTRLRFIGSAPLPPVVNVRLKSGENFTVGRYDAAIGKQQSSFEFDKKTKAVSRRHAVIERHADGYSIIDLSSSAGTFLNGQKLSPNAPYELSHGCRVSFGNAGADYVWEST